MDSAQSHVFGAYGGNCRTPFTDQLAAEGVRFTEHFTSTPMCHPARACISTGLLPHANGFITNRGGGAYPFNIFAGVRTTAELLAENGYRCGYAGQAHIDLTGIHDDYSYPSPAYTEYLKSRGLSESIDPNHALKGGGKLALDIEDARDTRYTAQALDLLDEYSKLDEPWFIQFDFDGPHPICKVPDPFFGRHDASHAVVPESFNDTLEDKPNIHLANRLAGGTQEWNEEEWRTFTALYYDMISFLDSLVGRVLNRLDDHGLKDDTIVILTSDHGGMCGSHGILMHGTPAMPTEVMRVPLVVRAPGSCEAGRAVDVLTSHVDLLPAIVDLAGGKLETPTHGRSWAGLLEGTPPNDWRDAVGGQYHGTGVLFYSTRMLRTKEWNYVWHSTGEEELYDLQRDPFEMTNLSVDHEAGQELLKARHRLNNFMQETKDPLEKHGFWQRLVTETPI